MPDFRNIGLNSRQKGKIIQYINKYNYAVCKNKAIKLFNEFYDKKICPHYCCKYLPQLKLGFKINVHGSGLGLRLGLTYWG